MQMNNLDKYQNQYNDNQYNIVTNVIQQSLFQIYTGLLWTGTTKNEIAFP